MAFNWKLGYAIHGIQLEIRWCDAKHRSCTASQNVEAMHMNVQKIWHWSFSNSRTQGDVQRGSGNILVELQVKMVKRCTCTLIKCGIGTSVIQGDARQCSMWKWNIQVELQVKMVKQCTRILIKCGIGNLVTQGNACKAMFNAEVET